MEIYFDNAATTKVIPEVKNIMAETLDEAYGNPSSLHKKGVEAEKYIKNSKDILGKCLKCEPKEIIFTSGGTEANNLAILGMADANKRAGKHIISSRVEHASVYNPLFYLEEQGYRVTYLSVDSSGLFDLEELEKKLCDDTILVTLMAVNNEIGTIEPIEEAAKIISDFNKRQGKNVLLHVDAVQAFGKQIIYPKRIGINAMSVSGHKIHGPKGSGALFVDSKTKIKPILFGGGQEKGLRSGTENTTAIAGLGKACEIMYKNMQDNTSKMERVKRRLIEGALQIDGVKNNSGDAPHIASLSFPGIKSEVLLHALEEKGIYVSAGSACSSNHPAISGVLKAIGLDEKLLDSTLRFSFSEFNTEEEADYTVEKLKELIPILRKFTAK